MESYLPEHSDPWCVFSFVLVGRTAYALAEHNTGAKSFYIAPVTFKVAEPVTAREFNRLETWALQTDNPVEARKRWDEVLSRAS